jgi:tetratricopeptide (TPR) repeat protein
MLWRTLKILIAFAAILWVAQAVFNPVTPGGPTNRDRPRRLFEKDLVAKLNRDLLVVVDEEESDRYIQEDLSTHDLSKALTFARLKSEVLERALFIKDKSTFGTKDSVAQVNPTDRKAWQELTLLEMDLKRDFARKNPKNLKGYLEASALDSKRTPEAMVAFIDRYPDSQVASTALAHLEYALCVAQKNPQRALAVYDKMAKRHPDQAYLLGLLPDYCNRARQYQEILEEKKKATR